MHLRRCEGPHAPLCAGGKPLAVLSCNRHMLNGTTTGLHFNFTKLTPIPHLSAGLSIILDLLIPRPVEAALPVRYFSESSEA